MTPDWPIPDEVILANAAARRRYEQARRREETLIRVIKVMAGGIFVIALAWWLCVTSIDLVDYVRGVTR